MRKREMYPKKMGQMARVWHQATFPIFVIAHSKICHQWSQRAYDTQTTNDVV